MLTQQKASTSKKKNILLLSVLVVALAAIGYLLYVQFFSAPPAPVVTQTQYREAIATDFESSLFEAEKFIKLRIFGQFPIVVNSVGNSQLIKF